MTVTLLLTKHYSLSFAFSLVATTSYTIRNGVRLLFYKSKRIYKSLLIFNLILASKWLVQPYTLCIKLDKYIHNQAVIFTKLIYLPSFHVIMHRVHCPSHCYTSTHLSEKSLYKQYNLQSLIYIGDSCLGYIKFIHVKKHQVTYI